MSWKIKDISDLENRLLIGSTLVEGSTLSEDEAKQVLQGKTVSGHPISEARELINYRTAVERLIGELEASPFLSKDLIQNFHQRLFTDFPGTHGSWKSDPNYTYLSSGERMDFAPPSKVESMMAAWIDDFNQKTQPDPVAQAANLYYRFQMIHPFSDGNGRIGRVFVSYFLHLHGKSFFEFYSSDRIEHLGALEAANRGSFEKLIEFFKKRTKRK